MGDENIISIVNIFIDFIIIIFIFLYSFTIKLDSEKNSLNGLSDFEKEYTKILKNIINLFKTEINIFSPFFFSFLTFFFYISNISKYIISEYYVILIFIFVIPILLLGLILFITGFFSYINNADLDKRLNNIYIYIHCIVLFLTIYSLSYPINNILNNNNKFTKDLLIIMIILGFVTCFSIFIILIHENIRKYIYSIFDVIDYKENINFLYNEIPIYLYLIFNLLLILGLYFTARFYAPREISIYAMTLITLVSYFYYIFQKSKA